MDLHGIQRSRHSESTDGNILFAFGNQRCVELAKLKKISDLYTATIKGFGTDLLPPGYGYGKKYRYKINLNQFGVGFEILNWCLKNCKSKWGWYFVPTRREDDYLDFFENQDAILTFKSKQDAVYFKLTHA